MRCTAPMNAPGPPPTMPRRRRRGTVGCWAESEIISLSPVRLLIVSSMIGFVDDQFLRFCRFDILAFGTDESATLRQAEHAAICRLVGAGTGEVVEGRGCSLNN